MGRQSRQQARFSRRSSASGLIAMHAGLARMRDIVTRRVYGDRKVCGGAKGAYLRRWQFDGDSAGEEPAHTRRARLAHGKRYASAKNRRRTYNSWCAVVAPPMAVNSEAKPSGTPTGGANAVWLALRSTHGEPYATPVGPSDFRQHASEEL